jgi:hypothetical protein
MTPILNQIQKKGKIKNRETQNQTTTLYFERSGLLAGPLSASVIEIVSGEGMTRYSNRWDKVNESATFRSYPASQKINDTSTFAPGVAMPGSTIRSRGYKHFQNYRAIKKSIDGVGYIDVHIAFTLL